MYDSAVPVSTEELMGRYADGHAEAFDCLFRRLASTLLGYLLRLTRNRAQAEDLLQVTFAKMHRARGSYRRGAPVLPWSIVIARRSFIGERRAAAARREGLTADGSLPEPPADAPSLRAPMLDELEAALQRLPENYREAIELTKITGLSIQEAAIVLGTTQSAVKLRVHRGYNRLRKELALEPCRY